MDKLIYDLVIAKPAFPFITDYAWNSMNAVDEALALIRMKEIPVKNELGNVDKPEPDVLYKDTFEYGYNEIDNDDEPKDNKDSEINESDQISDMYDKFKKEQAKKKPVKNKYEKKESEAKEPVKNKSEKDESIKALEKSSKLLEDAINAAREKVAKATADRINNMKKKQ